MYEKPALLSMKLAKKSMKYQLEAGCLALGRDGKTHFGFEIPGPYCQMVTERQLTVKFSLRVSDSGK